MSYKTLYLNWDFDGTVWKGSKVRLHIPDEDDSVKTYLEAYIEEYYEIAQLHIDYISMYINHSNNPVLPPPFIMKSADGKTITVSFSFQAPE